MRRILNDLKILILANLWLVPVLAGLAAVPLLGEPLTASLLVGLCAVSAGAWYAARPVKAS